MPPHGSDEFDEFNLGNILYTDSVHTSQETHDVSATETNRLMLFRENVTVCFENRLKHTNREFLRVKAGGTYSNHWVLKGYSNAITEHRTSPHIYFV
jgi:hypothetical protein